MRSDESLLAARARGSQVHQPGAAARDGVPRGVVEAGRVGTHQVDEIVAAARQAADRAVPLGVVNHLVAAVETSGREDDRVLRRAHCARRIEAERSRLQADEIRARVGQAGDRAIGVRVVGHCVAGVQAGAQPDENAVARDVDDGIVERGIARVQDAVFGGSRIDERVDGGGVVTERVLVVIELGWRQWDHEARVEHRRIWLQVAELPVGLVVLPFRGDVSLDRRIELVVVVGTGQPEALPYAVAQLVDGALVDARVAVLVEQAAVWHVDPDIAAGVDEVDAEVAALLLQIDVGLRRQGQLVLRVIRRTGRIDH